MPKDKQNNKYRKRTLPSGKVIYQALIAGSWRSTGQTSLSGAINWRAKNESGILNKKQDEDPLLKDFAKDFFNPNGLFASRKAKKGKDHSLGVYKHKTGRMQNYILPQFGEFRLSEITTRQVDDWLINLKGNNNKTLSADSKNKILYALKEVLEEALQQELINTNPLDRIEPFAVKSKERGIFTDKELSLFFPQDINSLTVIWANLQWAAYFLALRDTGCRLGELNALQWQDLWQQKDSCGFIVNKATDSYTKEVKPSTKTGYDRAVLLTNLTYNVLLRWRNESRFNSNNDLIFTFDGSRPFIAESILKHLRLAAKNAGIDLTTRTPYCFRHTANTQMLLHAHPADVQLLMGHRSNKETVNYNHPSRDLLIAKASAKIEVINKRFSL